MICCATAARVCGVCVVGASSSEGYWESMHGAHSSVSFSSKDVFGYAVIQRYSWYIQGVVVVDVVVLTVVVRKGSWLTATRDAPFVQSIFRGDTSSPVSSPDGKRAMRLMHATHQSY